MEKEQVLNELKQIAINRFDVVGFFGDSLDKILKPALDDVVKDTENPYDDMAVAALYPVLDKALKAKIQELMQKVTQGPAV